MCLSAELHLCWSEGQSNAQSCAHNDPRGHKPRSYYSWDDNAEWLTESIKVIASGNRKPRNQVVYSKRQDFSQLMKKAAVLFLSTHS